MSNAGLRAQVSQLSSELSKLQAYNRELRQEINYITGQVRQSDQKLTNVQNRARTSLEVSGRAMTGSHTRIIDAYELQGDIERLYKIYKILELANKNIRAANNKKYYDFKNYRTVRKIVQGIMDNLDLQMVSGETILKAVEVQHLQTPDFWLTCVLISIMAWTNDDKELADRAMGEAVKLDKKNAAVFYMLFNMRMDRTFAAQEWFKVYQQCPLKGEDQRTFLMLFSLISPTLGDRIDDQTFEQIKTFVFKVMEENRKANFFSEEDIISHIKAYFKTIRTPLEGSYPQLRKHVPSYDSMMSVARDAVSNKGILEFILGTIHVSKAEKNLFIKGFVDELIEKPNPAELSVYQDIEFNELIIELQGDKEKAEEVFQQRKEHEKNELNLIDEMITWIYSRENLDINPQIRSSLFTLTKQYQKEGVAAYSRDYESRWTTSYGVNIGEYTTTADLSNVDSEKAKLADYISGLKADALEGVKNLSAYIGFALAGIGAVAGVFAGISLGFAATLAGAGYGGVKLLLNSKERKNIAQRFELEEKQKQKVLEGLAEEFALLAKEKDGGHSYNQKIIAEIEKI